MNAGHPRLRGGFCSAPTGLVRLLDGTPGRRSQTRFALGCHVSGFQPCDSVSIGV
jgi:hypothetical protein